MPAEQDASRAVVRIARIRAREGRRAELVRAAHSNTRDALAGGALTAEVCEAPGDADEFLVISRWSSQASLTSFLGWHQQQAHESMADHSEGKPVAVHHPVISPDPSS